MTRDTGSFDQIDQWKSTMFLYSSALKSINTKIEILNNEFIQLYNYNPIEHITSRLKTPASIVKKLQNDGREVTIENMVEHLNDIAGIRIICSFMSDIYPIADMIARQADITVLHVKDYIRYPKSNGYKSYHMVVTIPVYLTDGKRDTKVEIQIRTIAMDFWASLEHKIAYKFEGNPPDYLEAELKACADMVDGLDKKMFSLNQTIMEIEEQQRKEKAKRHEMAAGQESQRQQEDALTGERPAMKASTEDKEYNESSTSESDKGSGARGWNDDRLHRKGIPDPFGSL